MHCPNEGPRYLLGLQDFVLCTQELHSPRHAGPERLQLQFGVDARLCENFSRGVEDRGDAAVVLGQLNRGAGVPEVAQEAVADDGHVCPAPPVDGLVGVSDHEETSLPLSVPREELHQGILRRIRVLEFVHQDVSEALTSPLLRPLGLLEYRHCEGNHVVEVKKVGSPQGTLIVLEKSGEVAGRRTAEALQGRHGTGARHPEACLDRALREGDES